MIQIKDTPIIFMISSLDIYSSGQIIFTRKDRIVWIFLRCGRRGCRLAGDLCIASSIYFIAPLTDCAAIIDNVIDSNALRVLVVLIVVENANNRLGLAFCS